ncbi:MAG: hypothetical protein IKU07_09750 [Oscillospiraceae bacterium]|nr:hypothetical protein [Oscillospiraceae bacterium]
MGIFDIFKKKKAVPTTEEKLNKMWDLWASNKLDLPCAKLMKYESEVNNGGHSQYFFNVANCGDLAVEVEAVLSMLPEPLRENLARGYAAFSEQDDISDDVNDELFEECDDVFYEHEQLIIDIIYETAKNFEG